jgi:hypothetical protein
MKQILLLVTTIFLLVGMVAMILFFSTSTFTKIILGIIVVELVVIIAVYIYDILCPREGIVYYKRADFVNDTRPTMYTIKIKRKFFGYPFIRVCRVSKEVYDSLTFGDTYNCTAGRITKP